MNAMTERYGTDEDDSYDQYEEDEQPTDRQPEPYPSHTPVKLLLLKEKLIRNPETFDHSAYIKRSPTGGLTTDFAGAVVLDSGAYTPIWEDDRDRVTQVCPAPSPGIPESCLRIELPDAAQSVLGISDREAELLFYGEDLAGNENPDLCTDFLEYLIERSTGPFPSFRMYDEEVGAFRTRWSLERGITDPHEPWQEGQVSPRAFAA